MQIFLYPFVLDVFSPGAHCNHKITRDRTAFTLFTKYLALPLQRYSLMSRPWGQARPPDAPHWRNSLNPWKKSGQQSFNYARDCLPNWRKMAAPGQPSGKRAPPILSVSTRRAPNFDENARGKEPIAIQLNLRPTKDAHARIAGMQLPFSSNTHTHTNV